MEQEYNDDDYISKSERKRESDRLQELGEKLMSLKAGDLNRLPLSDRLRRAIDESRRITAHEARRRHAQFVGRVMREDSGDQVEQALEALDNPYRARWLMDWLDKLLALADMRDSEAMIQEMLEQYPHGDRQHLRNLCRNVLQARVAEDAERAAKDKFKRERRKLSDYLNELEKLLPLY